MCWRRRARSLGAFGLLLGASLACGRGEGSPSTASHTYDVDARGIPRLAGSVYLDLSETRPGGVLLVNRISRFRSTLGHDYSDSYECCRSMKHYFMAPDVSTRIYAPVTGVVAWRDAGPGTQSVDQINVASDVEPAFVFTIMHVVLDRAFRVGDHLTEGEPIGHHVGSQTWSDIAVSVDDGRNAPKTCGAGPSGRLVSYFATLTDAAFQVFAARGIATPDELIISRAERDAAPPPCIGDGFDPSWTDPLPTAVDF